MHPERIGRYRVLGELGRGAMGQVYIAYDPNVERRVALKVMSPAAGEDPEDEAELRHRFLLEARAAGRLAHPGIVAVHDADTDPASGLPFIAMELVEGESLESLLRREGRLGALVAVDLAARMARALGYAHGKGIVHRDVKPANILLAADGGAKIADFGIAKLGGLGVTRAGRVLGSPYFMSPEQVQGLAIDGRSDLFSLGAVLYRAVTGELPFPGEVLVTVAYKVVQVDARPVDPALGFPASLSDLLARSMAKDPLRRFASAEEMAVALESIGKQLLEARGFVGATPSQRSLTGIVTTVPVRTTPFDRGETLVLDGDGTAPPLPPSASRETSPGARQRPRRRRWILAAGLLLAVAATSAWLARSWAPTPEETPPATSRASSPEVLVEPPGADEVPNPEADRDSGRIPDPERAAPLAPLPTGAAATPVPLPTEPQEEREVPANRADSILHFAYRNRLGSATMSILVDGRTVWSKEIEAPPNPLARAFGDEMLETVPVPSGERTVEVRVRGRSMNVDASAKIQGRFEPRGRRWLRITLNPYAEKVKLAWTGE